MCENNPANCCCQSRVCVSMKGNEVTDVGGICGGVSGGLYCSSMCVFCDNCEFPFLCPPLFSVALVPSG